MDIDRVSLKAFRGKETSWFFSFVFNLTVIKILITYEFILSFDKTKMNEIVLSSEEIVLSGTLHVSLSLSFT